jgi:hypothetical protein
MPNLDLTTVDGRETASSLIEQALDAYVKKTRGEPYRSHLGASIIGHNCGRYLWYHFRWMFKATASARMYRLWHRGHREEIYIRELLRGAGATFLDKVDSTGEQVHVSFFGGHAGGSVDGVLCWPEIGLPQPMILECKTSRDGKPFNDALSRPLPEHNLRHYKQQSIYGKGLNIRYVLYVMVNKNNDEWTWELVELDPIVGDEMVQKMFTIITAPAPLPRLSDRPEYYECKSCEARHICHEKAEPAHNCRSCRFAVPIEDGTWFCNLHKATLPKHFLPQGCDKHQTLPK